MSVKIAIIVGVFILLDVITGLLAAVKTGEYKSSIMRDGLWAKGGELLALGVSAFCEYALPTVGVDIQLPIFTGIGVYICVMELGSCVENITKLSPELKGALHKYLGMYKQETK